MEKNGLVVKYEKIRQLSIDVINKHYYSIIYNLWKFVVNYFDALL